jgi:signal transduction histidine kinase
MDEDRLPQQALKSNCQGILVVQHDGVVVSTNLAGLQSIAPGTIDDLPPGAHFTECLHIGSRTDARAAWESFVKHGEPSHVEARASSGEVVLLAFVGGVAADRALVIVQPSATALEERLGRLHALNAVWRALSSSLELTDVLEHMFRHLHTVLPFDTASVLLRERDGYRIARTEGINPDKFPSDIHKRMADLPTTQWLLKHKRSLVIPDVREFEMWVAPPADLIILSWIGVPLIAHGEVLGVLSLDSQTSNTYTEADGTLAFAFGQQAATAIANARHYQEEKARANRLAALYRIGLAISKPDVDEVLRLVAQQVGELLDVRTFYIALYNEETDELDFRLHYERGELMPPSAVPAAQSLVGWVIQNRESIILQDATVDPTPVPVATVGGTEATRSVVLAPMIAGGEVVGVFSVQSFEPNAFDPDDISLIDAVASQTAVAVRNAKLFNQTSRRLAALEALQETGVMFASAADSITALEKVARTVAEITEADAVCICITDELHAANLAPQRSPNGRRGWADCPTGMGVAVGKWPGRLLSGVERQLESRLEPLIVPDIALHEQFTALLTGQEAARVGSLAAFPIKQMDDALGYFSLYYRQPHHFLADEVRLLKLLVDQMALSIDAAHHYQETQRRLREMTALYEVAKDSAFSLDLETILTNVLRTLKELFDCRGASLALLDEGAGEIVIQSSVGLDDRWRDAARLKVGEGISGQVVETGQSIYVPDTAKEPDFIYFDPNLRSLIVVPLRYRDRVTGTLSLDSYAPNAFTAEDERLLTIAAAQVAVAIENARLHTTLHDRAAKLEHANAELEELNELRNELIANVSHDLRSPLTFLRGYIGLILDEALGPITPQQVEAMNVIQEKTDAIERLIDDIMNMERITAGSLQCSRQNLNDIARRAVTDAQFGLGDRDLHFECRLASAPLPVSIDRERINQALSNLINNAVKFTPDGGRITVETGLSDAGEATLSIADTGIGIAKEAQKHVFERFYRGDKHSKESTGLGLSIVKRIVEAHGGRVWVESEPGVGSIFTFALPVAGNNGDATTHES